MKSLNKNTYLRKNLFLVKLNSIEFHFYLENLKYYANKNTQHEKHFSFTNR